MSGAWKRLVRALRSRRLAAVLITGLLAYAVIGTLVPRGAATDPSVRTWSTAHPVAAAIAGPLGLFRGFASPLFMATMALLVASTAACATERTVRARRSIQSVTRVPEGLAGHVTEHAQIVLQVADTRDAEDVLFDAARRLRRLRLRVDSGDGLAYGRAGGAGPVASAVFHWAIVGLILVAAAGQATRAEGVMGLPEGERVADERANYRSIAESPLFGARFTGIELVATDIVRHYRVGNVDYGAAPRISAWRDGDEIASGRVYPNSPLRVGSLLVHMVDFGPAAVVAVERPYGGEIARGTLLLDRSTSTESGTVPQSFVAASSTGGTAVEVRLQVLTGASSVAATQTPGRSRALVEVLTPESGASTSTVVAEGDTVPLPGGERLRLVQVKDWASVSVANDWSVPFLYGIFVVAVGGLGVAVLAPLRRVGVTIATEDGAVILRARVWHARRDPIFHERIEAVLRAAAGSEEAS